MLTRFPTLFVDGSRVTVYAAIAITLALTLLAAGSISAQEEAHPDAGEVTHSYLPTQQVSNLAAFRMMERFPLAFTTLPAAVDRQIDENIDLFEMMERTPGLFTDADNPSDSDNPGSTLTHPWGGDSLYPAY